MELLQFLTPKELAILQSAPQGIERLLAGNPIYRQQTGGAWPWPDSGEAPPAAHERRAASAELAVGARGQSPGAEQPGAANSALAGAATHEWWAALPAEDVRLVSERPTGEQVVGRRVASPSRCALLLRACCTHACAWAAELYFHAARSGPAVRLAQARQDAAVRGLRCGACVLNCLFSPCLAPAQHFCRALDAWGAGHRARRARPHELGARDYDAHHTRQVVARAASRARCQDVLPPCTSRRSSPLCCSPPCRTNDDMKTFDAINCSNFDEAIEIQSNTFFDRYYSACTGRSTGPNGKGELRMLPGDGTPRAHVSTWQPSSLPTRCRPADAQAQGLAARFQLS